MNNPSQKNKTNINFSLNKIEMIKIHVEDHLIFMENAFYLPSPTTHGRVICQILFTLFLGF